MPPRRPVLLPQSAPNCKRFAWRLLLTLYYAVADVQPRLGHRRLNFLRGQTGGGNEQVGARHLPARAGLPCEPSLTPSCLGAAAVAAAHFLRTGYSPESIAVPVGSSVRPQTSLSPRGVEIQIIRSPLHFHFFLLRNNRWGQHTL